MKNPRILCHGVLRTEASPQLELLHSGSLTTLVYGFRLAFCYSFGFQVLRLCATPEGNLAQFTLVITSAGAHTLAFPLGFIRYQFTPICYLFFPRIYCHSLPAAVPSLFSPFPLYLHLLKSFSVNLIRFLGAGGGAETNLRGEHTLCNSNNHK